MKCPLRTEQLTTRPDWTQYSTQDCLKEECAWWYKDGARCCILDIDLTLNTIDISLSDIEKEMPRAKEV